MNETIILGNGININFDTDKVRWSGFVSDCQAEFLVMVNDAKESKSKMVNGIYWVWMEIKKHINLDNEKNLEEFVRFFNIVYYEKIMDQYEFEFFWQGIWGITMSPFMEHNSSYEVPGWSMKTAIELNTHLDNLKEMYKKAIKTVLISEYKINEIIYSSKFIKKLGEDFTQVISLNYDANLDQIKDVIYLHGKYGKNALVIKDEKKILKNLEQFKLEKYGIKLYINFIKENTLSEDIILENSSSLKQRRLQLHNKVKEMGIKNFLESLGLSNKLIDEQNISIELIDSYVKLENLSGQVTLLGISPSCDEKIFEILNKNKKIEKILIYCDLSKGYLKYSKSKKISLLHYNDFWNKVNS